VNPLDLLGPHLREAIEQLIDERVEQRLAAIARAEPPSRYMTIPEAAELLRCKRQRIDDLLSSGRLSRVKDGSRTLIARGEIEGYVERGGRSESR
jgi:excisionase family DNA binding protein